MNKSEFESLLARLQESARHLLKADALALAGLVTLASLFKLDPTQALDFATQRLWVIEFIVYLMVGLLVFEGFLVTLSREDNAREYKIFGRISRVVYGVLVVLHTGAMLYTLGYITGFLRSRAHG